MDLKDIEEWGRELLQSEARKRGVKNPEMYSRSTLVRMILKQDYGAPRNVREAARLIGGIWGSAKKVVRARLGSGAGGAGVRTYVGAARAAGARDAKRAAAAARGADVTAAPAAAHESERVRSGTDGLQDVDRKRSGATGERDASAGASGAEAAASERVQAREDSGDADARRDESRESFDAREAGSDRRAGGGRSNAEGATRGAAQISSGPRDAEANRGAVRKRPEAEDDALREAARMRSESQDAEANRDADRRAVHGWPDTGAPREAGQTRAESLDADAWRNAARGAAHGGPDADEDARREAARVSLESHDADAQPDAGRGAVHGRPDEDEDALRESARVRSESRGADAQRDADRGAVHARTDEDEDALREAARVRSESRDARRDSERVRADARASVEEHVRPEPGWHELPFASTTGPRETGASDFSVGRDEPQLSAADSAASRGVDRTPGSSESGVRPAADELELPSEDVEAAHTAETQTHLRLVESPAESVEKPEIASRSATLVPGPAFATSNLPEALRIATPFESAEAVRGEQTGSGAEAGSVPAGQHLSYGPHPREGLLVRWQVTPEAIERARKVLGSQGELAVRIVAVRVNLHAVVKTDVIDHGPVAAAGDWTAPLLPTEARYVSAVGLRSPMRFVSIVHAAS